MESRIAFLGGGNMAQAMVQGLVNRGYDPGNITVLDRHAEKLDDLHTRFGIQTTQDYQTAIDFAHVVVLAVKPQGFNELKATIKPMLKARGAMVVSIMSGILLETLAHEFKGLEVVRVMPNTPVGINEGVCLLAANKATKESAIATVKRFLSLLGLVYVCSNEREFDQLTILTGCGPAFVFHTVDAMAQAMKTHSPKADTLPLAIATFKGSIALMSESHLKPGELITQVTSKGGLTEAGMRVLNQADMKKTFEQTIEAAIARGDELAKS